MPSKAQKRKRNAARRHGTEAAKKRAGGTALLTNENEVQQDAAMIVAAVRKRFPVTQTIAGQLVRRLADIAEKKSVDVATKSGVVQCEATADKHAIAASNALRAMFAMNQRDEIEAVRKSQPKTTQPQTTINVGVNVDNRIDERRNRTLAIAERVRAGRVLVSDSGE